jgi:phosphomannomutase / phosphoglucomutase
MSSMQTRLARLQAWIQTHPWKAGAVLCALLALWFGFNGLDIYGQNKTERDVLAARDKVVKSIAPFSKSRIAQMLEAQKQVGPLAFSSEHENIGLIFKNTVEGAELVEVHPVDLTAAYANVAKFGAGKLAVLEAGANDEQVAFRIIKVSGAPKLAMVKMIGSGVNDLLVYVQVPLAGLDKAMDLDIPENTYLAIRQNRVDLLQRGDQSLAATAENSASAIPQTPWRVVASAPLAEKGMFEAGGSPEIGLALLFALAALACLAAPAYLKKRRASAEEDMQDGAELTIGEMKAQGIIVPELDVPKPVFNIRETTRPKVPLERSIFRAYDIRGVVGTNLDAGIARLIGEVIGTILVEKGLHGIVVGYDGRLSSVNLADGLNEGLVSAGVSVLNIGQVPTPLVYFATHNSEFSSGISVTGSHNPPDYNGFKIVIDGHTLSGDEITGIFERIVEKKVIQAKQPGHVSTKNIVPDYTRFIADDIQIDRRLKVVVDCGNGVPGAVAPDVLTAIGAEVESIYCEVDGNFPNHHPDPSDPDNLVDLIEVVKRSGADIGLAFDGDGDRMGVVTAQGQIIFPDRLLMLFAEDVLHRNPGAAIIYDVKCTGALQGHILRHGGSPIMWKTGHSLIKAKMKETHAELAGEMSGHFFFAERWFGFDDGIYAAARLLEILAAAPEGIQALFDALPSAESTPELKVELKEGEQHAFIERFVAKAQFEGARINTIDGIRADWSDGWGLVRASNTTPVLVLRFEAESKERLAQIKQIFREQMLALDPGLTLPF